MATSATRATSARVKKVTICGFGLIGGSIALDLQKQNSSISITACDRPNVLKQLARDKRFRVTAEPKLRPAVASADIVILSGPLPVIKQHLKQLSSLSDLTDCLIIDTGSVKSSIVKTASKLTFGSGIEFMPCHPMAGRETSGFRSAALGLFKNLPWFMDESVKLSSPGSSRMNWLIKKLKARPVHLSMKLHDEILSEISHLPQLLSTILAAQMNASLLKLAGPGLKSMLRLAGSDFELWSGIIEENRTEIIKALDTYEKNVKTVKARIRRRESLAAIFKEAARSYRCL